MNKNRYLSILVLILTLLMTPLGPSFPAQAAGSGCVTSSPSSGAYTVTVCLTSPVDGSQLSGDNTVTATFTVTPPTTSVQEAVYYLNGAYLLTSYQSPYTFTLPTTQWVDGSYTLAVEGWMRDGFISQQANLTVTFNNRITTPPVNTNTFQPSTGNPANSAPFIVAAAGDGASGETHSQQVSDLIVSLNPNLFVYLGDVYENGSTAEFYNWYGIPSTYFDRLRSITDPTVGNHEYSTTGASAYFNYWNNIPDYYSYNANGWHFISLDSNYHYISGGVGAGSKEYQWLQQDLAANTAACTIAYYHHPLFDIGQEGPTAQMADIWNLLAQNGVSIVLNGHDHDYQRYVPLDGSGNPSPTGMTEFVAGGAGHGLNYWVTPPANEPRLAYSNNLNPAAFGVLLLQLNQNGANFTYLNSSRVVLDSGVVPCVTSGADTQAPSVPGGLSWTSVSLTQVSLSWNPASDDTGVAAYTVYRNGAAIGTVSATVVPGSNVTYSDMSVAPSTTYSYSIDAYDLAGNHSAASTPISVTTPDLPTSSTFTPAADTYVNANSPSTNYGTATSMRLDVSPDEHGYARFNVTGSVGRPVVSAQLRLYANSSGSSGLNALAVADNTWGETTTTYNNPPALGSLLASTGPFTAGTWVSLDVSSYISGDGTYSFGITTPGSISINLASHESGANSPQLIVNYAGSATSTPTASITPSPTPTGSYTWTPTKTPTPTRTPSPTRTPTSTRTPTPTRTPTNTRTPTVTRTPTKTRTSTVTWTPTKTLSPTPTWTVEGTTTPTFTQTDTALPTDTPTPTPTTGSFTTFFLVADRYVNASSPFSNYGTAASFGLDFPPEGHGYHLTTLLRWEASWLLWDLS